MSMTGAHARELNEPRVGAADTGVPGGGSDPACVRGLGVAAGPPAAVCGLAGSAHQDYHTVTSLAGGGRRSL